MWAEQLPNGKYRFVERYTDPVTGQSRRVSVTLDRNTAQSRKMASEILRQKMEAACPSALKLSELIALYNAEQAETVKRSTATRNAGILDRVMRVLGDVRLDKLTAGYIRRKFADSGKGNTTLNEYLVRFKSLMRWAYKYDYISDIRFVDKLDRLPEPTEREKVQDKYLESSELSALIRAMEISRWRNVTEFLALSGLRFGEAAALNRSDVDLPRRVIHVTKTYDDRNRATTTPKTANSVRDVYMQDELLELCQRILRESVIININPLFFTQNGHYIHYDAYRQYLGDRAETSIGRRITPHTLRHTHASLMLEAGMDVDAIAARLGHSSTRITREIYLHVTEKLQEKRNAEIKNIRLII